MARNSVSSRKNLSTKYRQQSPQTMDSNAVLTGAKCQSCGSQTHQRNDCWYKNETCKTCGKRGHLAKVCRNAQTPRHGSAKGTGKGSGESSSKSKGKSKNRTPEICLCCGNEGHKKSDCKFKTDTCSNCGKVGHLSAARRNTKTHEIEKDADEPSPQVTAEAVWCMAVQDTDEVGHADCTENHDVSSEHRDEFLFTEFPEHHDESKFRKVIENIETGQNSEVVTKIEMDEQDRSGRQKSKHE